MKPFSSPLVTSIGANKTTLRIDYTDAYSGRFASPHRVGVEEAVRAFFFCLPKPALWLLRLREVVAKRMGLKTARGRLQTLKEIERFSGRVGERIALFEVWHRTENEIVTGQRDKHLHFALSFKLTDHAGVYTLTLTTEVQINNRLGRVYFCAVRPVHRMLMTVLVKRLCRRLANEV